MPLPTEENGQASRRSRRHFKPAEKYAAVHRVLRGEELNRVAAELSVSVERLQRWERVFLEGGRASLENSAEHRSGISRILWQKNVLPWVGLLLLLIAIVYEVSRFFQPSTG